MRLDLKEKYVISIFRFGCKLGLLKNIYSIFNFLNNFF